MKRFIAFVLMLVLVFSMGVPSFAVTSDDQATSLKSGWGSVSSSPSYPSGYNSSWFYLMLYHTYQIRQTLNSIDTDTGNIYSRLGLINDSFSDFLVDSNAIKLDVDSIQRYSQLINTTLNSVKVNSDSILSNVQSLVVYVDGVEGLITTTNSRLSSILDDTDMLQQVLADEEDLAFKESQKENQQYVQDTFFSSSSDLSLNLDDFGILTQYVREFKTGYNFEENIGNPLPLTLIDSESDFKDWFSDSTGQAMDPTFNGGSGGGGGETPGPDEPEPEPEPTIKNWLPLATTEPGGTEIYNGIGYLPGYRWSNSAGAPVPESGVSITGFIPCTVSDTIFLYNLNVNITVPVGILFNDSSRVYSIGGDILPSDANGVVSFTPSDYVSSCNYFRIVFSGESASNGIISINQYPIQSSSTFSLRAQSVPYVNEPEVVTSYYADRLLEVERIKGGNK